MRVLQPPERTEKRKETELGVENNSEKKLNEIEITPQKDFDDAKKPPKSSPPPPPKMKGRNWEEDTEKRWEDYVKRREPQTIKEGNFAKLTSLC